MKRLLKYLAGTAVAGTTLMVAGCQLTRVGYETASYQTQTKAERFEIRAYDDLVLVSTTMQDMGENGDGSSFMRLFRYISGDNTSEKKIAMTTPVFMNEGAEKTMSFVLPREVAEQGVPEGSDRLVSVGSLPSGRYAVLRLKGARSDTKVESGKQALAAWIAEQGLRSVGDYLVAGYDPPFTPAFAQRNEVLIRLAE
jgi:hypothetical protein